MSWRLAPKTVIEVCLHRRSQKRWKSSRLGGGPRCQPDPRGRRGAPAGSVTPLVMVDSRVVGARRGVLGGIIVCPMSISDALHNVVAVLGKSIDRTSPSRLTGSFGSVVIAAKLAGHVTVDDSTAVVAYANLSPGLYLGRPPKFICLKATSMAGYIC